MIFVDLKNLKGINWDTFAFILEDSQRNQLFRTDYTKPHKIEKTGFELIDVPDSVFANVRFIIYYPIYKDVWQEKVEICNGEIRLDHPLGPRTITPAKQIESFSIVCTHELKREAAMLLTSLRKKHDQPVYALVDGDTYDYLNGVLKQYHISNIEYIIAADNEHLEEARRVVGDRFNHIKTFHRTDCILKKMEILNIALKHYNNTFFLDSDIVVAQSLQENYNGEICLSPHYHSSEDKGLDSYVGIYNAGYLFVANKDFPEWWRENYLENSNFYEQHCMNRIPHRFKTDLFPKGHNIGFWRGDFKWEEDNIIIPDEGLIKSFHNHLTTKFDCGQPHKFHKKNLCLRKYIFEYFQRHNKELYDIFQSILLS